MDQQLYIVEENMRLKERLDKLSKQHSQALLFADFCSTLLKISDIEKVTRLIVEQMMKLVGTREAKMVRKEALKDQFAFYDFKNGNVEKIYLQRHELGEKCFFMYCKRIHRGDERNPFLAIPIKYEGENIGALLFEKVQFELLKTIDLTMLELFSMPAGLVIKNCLLLTQSEMEQQLIEKQHQTIQEDLQFAQKMQNFLMPRGYQNFREYTFYGDHKQAHCLGGDFYDVIQTDNDKIIFYMADVSGHGVAAALLTIFLKQAVKGIVQSFTQKTITPSAILGKLQSRFIDLGMAEELYIGIIIGILDINSNTIILSNAGHNVEPVYLKQNGKTIILDIKGLPINNWGMEEAFSFYGEERIRFHREDHLILLTDGVTEANGEDEKPFTIEEAGEFLKKNSGQRLDKQYEELIDKVYKLKGEKQLKDDIAFLGIYRK